MINWDNYEKRWIPFAKLFLRLVVGAIFIQAGWTKLNNPAMVQTMMTGINMPMPEIMGWVLTFTELLCGSLILLGLVTRLAAIPTMVVMLVAFFTVHLKDGLVATTWYVILIFFVLFFLSTSGAGQYSLDHLIATKKNPLK